MEFLRVKNSAVAVKSSEVKEPVIVEGRFREELKKENGREELKGHGGDSAGEIEQDDDDDDFISKEVKRQLKELRNKRFMVLIPEEPCEEDEDEEDDTGSSSWKELSEEGAYPWCGFESFYDKYCERMVFFDRMTAQRLQRLGNQTISNSSPQSASKKLAATLRSLSFKRHEGLQDDGEHLQQVQDDPHLDLETSYVAQVCLTWEALHCQYTQLSHKISLYYKSPTSCSHAAQQFQQFQVLLHRFIENEPFQKGGRVEIFARTRSSLPKLLHVPSCQDSDQKEEEDSDQPVLASDLFKVIENSIMTFCLFLKMDKKKTSSVLNLFGGHNHAATSFQQMLASLHKKKVRLKELRKKENGWKKKSWPVTLEKVELFFGLIDITVMSRVLRMGRISKEQLLWCEEKMSKLDISGSKLQRDGSPVLFPC